jgi:hypothetical protein
MRRARVGRAVRVAQAQHRPVGAKIDNDVPAILVGARIGSDKTPAPQQSPP